MAEGVAADAAVEAGLAGGGDHGPGQHTGVDVVAADVAGPATRKPAKKLVPVDPVPRSMMVKLPKPGERA